MCVIDVGTSLYNIESGKFEPDSIDIPYESPSNIRITLFIKVMA